jgi:hypothetical protein
VTRRDIIDELRLVRQYRHVLRAALLRQLSIYEAERRCLHVTSAQVASYANEICHDLRLDDQASFDHWLKCNGLSLEQFNELMRTELCRNIVLAEMNGSAQEHLVDVLRLSGLWSAVSKRAARKVELLNEAGLADPGFENTPFTDATQLISWWLVRESASPTAVTDVNALARSADFRDANGFIQALLREYCAEILGVEPFEDGRRSW